MRSDLCASALCFSLTLVLAGPALSTTTNPDALESAATSGQDPDESGRFARLEVHVTAVGGLSVYIDKGRVDKVQRGDVLLLFPSSGPQLRAVVRSVSKTSARAELEVTSSKVAAGDRGELLLPTERLAEPESDPGGKVVVAPGLAQEPEVALAPKPAQPEHPPWAGDISSVGADAPLLAPLKAQTPEERAATFFGRAWLDYSTTSDNQDTKTSYDSLRTGFDLTFENAFGKGGELEIDTELYRHTFDVAGGPSEDDSSIRVHRLSYLLGGSRTEPTSWQFGRFLSRGMSEFGLIDGVEWRHRQANGNSFGINLGALPVPNASLSSGDDVAIAVFHHWTANEDETLTLDSGFQKTWHKGKADRDLFVFTTNWRPADRVFVYATAWFDLYGSSELVKSTGPELTQFAANATWRTKAGDGLGLTLSRFRFPELLRQEFDPVSADELLNSEVTRVGLNGWKKVGEGLELRGRVDRWQDQDDTGGRAEIGFSARDRLYDGGTVRLDLFQDDNKYSSGPGARLTATKELAQGWLRLSYETAETQHDDFTGTQKTLARDVLRASWDMALGESWDLSLNAEQRSGDAENATTLGFYLQKRFR